MSPYITFKDSDSTGVLQLYICQREFPHYCAVLSFKPDLGAVACIPISRHNLWLTAAGSIRGNYYPSYQDVVEQIEACLIKMAEWFYLERIAKEPKRYKKWLIPGLQNTL